MDDAPDRDTEPVESGYLKLPWQLVAGVLFAVLAIALAAGLIASRNLREQLTVPTATPVALAAATATRAAPTASPVAIPTSAVTAIPTALPTPVPNLGSSTPAALATAFASPSPRPTVDPGLAEQVTEAYQRYWQLRAEALFALDTSRLDQVAAGEHLDQLIAYVGELRSRGEASQTNVDHHFVVLEASAKEAVIGDNYVSNSVFVDAMTHALLTEPTAGNLQEFYTLAYLDGGWKVVDVVRSP